MSIFISGWWADVNVCVRIDYASFVAAVIAGDSLEGLAAPAQPPVGESHAKLLVRFAGSVPNTITGPAFVDCASKACTEITE